MILFPHCKINLGLHIVARRPDGYHDIETLFYPVCGLCDAVEILAGPDNGPDNGHDSDSRPGKTPGNHPETIPGKTGERETDDGKNDDGITFTSTGLTVDCPPEKNLCVRACRLLREAFPEPFEKARGLRLHLHKRIPFGAGLGGGSADATAVLKGLNDLLALGLTTEGLVPYAARLGSDTVFFLHDEPMLGTGRGERLAPCPVPDLAGWWLLLVKPDVGVSTAEAYSLVTPRPPRTPLPEILRLPVEAWRGRLVNDFEAPLFGKLPLLGEIEAELYRLGAAYAALSGSGSTLFGLFREKPAAEGLSVKFFTHIERL